MAKPLIGKEESRRIRVEIGRVLLEIWDPIGVRDEPNAQDEYNNYVGHLYELLVSRAPEAKLSEYLYWVAHKQMGFESERASDTASTVEALKSIPLSSPE